MEYIVGKTAGFCYGVKNAVEKSLKTLENEKTMCCLGEIVHNKNVVNDLEQKGMKFIETLDQNTNNRKTIIRAHGVTKNIYETAKDNKIELIDLTCPKVLKIHKIVSEYNKKNYYTILIGAKKHPEIIGTASFAGDDVFIVESEDDIKSAIKNYEMSQKPNLLVVVQTTFSLSKFLMLSEMIKNMTNENVEIINTICNATKVRQEETEKISKEVDFMIIIGGKNSSNTKKLYEIATKNCNNTICIENCNEITIEQLSKAKKVGIMAGASTPQKSIDEVVHLVKNT